MGCLKDLKTKIQGLILLLLTVAHLEPVRRKYWFRDYGDGEAVF